MRNNRHAGLVRLIWAEYVIPPTGRDGGSVGALDGPAVAVAGSASPDAEPDVEPGALVAGSSSEITSDPGPDVEAPAVEALAGASPRARVPASLSQLRMS